MDEERIMPGHWLGLVLGVPSSALTLMIRWQQKYLAHNNPVPLISEVLFQNT